MSASDSVMIASLMRYLLAVLAALDVPEAQELASGFRPEGQVMRIAAVLVVLAAVPDAPFLRTQLCFVDGDAVRLQRVQPEDLRAQLGP